MGGAVIDVLPVHSTQVDRVWDEVAPLIQRALDRSNGTYLLEDVYGLLIEGKQQLLVAVKDNKIAAALITEVIDYPRKRAIRLTLGGGSHLQEWGPKLNALMDLGAKQVGAELIEVHGRKGWLRYLKALCGAKTETVLMTRAAK